MASLLLMVALAIFAVPVTALVCGIGDRLFTRNRRQK